MLRQTISKPKPSIPSRSVTKHTTKKSFHSKSIPLEKLVLHSTPTSSISTSSIKKSPILSKQSSTQSPLLTTDPPTPQYHQSSPLPQKFSSFSTKPTKLIKSSLLSGPISFDTPIQYTSPLTSPNNISQHSPQTSSTSSFSTTTISPSDSPMSTPEESIPPTTEVQEQSTQEPVQQQQKPQKEKKPKEPKVAATAAGKKNNASSSLGVSAKKGEDFSKWFQQLVVRSELIDYYDISGCYILRPWSYEIWELIKDFLDGEFKKLGVKNCYFPMFVPKKNLEKEQAHVEGFSAEVAWVTHSGNTKLEEPIAVRPTSETGMYPTFSKWIHSHRDLPLLLNQWCNVVRWEFKDPTPFIRSREFLWQEGHTVHSNLPDSEKEVLQILDIYARAYEEILACSVVKGKKTDFEKFAGGHYTTTVEGYIPGSGRGIQAATSHCLGQNFSKMFNIQFQGESGEQEFAWQNSWGFTTRSIGVMIMTHSDDKGLVLPPKIAPIQVVVIPIVKGENATVVNEAAEKLVNELKTKGVRVQLDARLNVTPGFKYNHWELKGVPLRVEVGGRDIENQTAFVARRDLGTKQSIPWANFGNDIEALLETIQLDLRTKAKTDHNSAIKQTRTWEEFMDNLKQDRLNLVPWCGATECEQAVKVKSGEDSVAFGGDRVGAAKSLCIPFQQPEGDITQEKCIKCAEGAKSWVLFGRSY